MILRHLLLGLLLWAAPAWAWDARGHRTVMDVALHYLAPRSRDWLEDCLLHHPNERARDLWGASCWPDWIRHERPHTGPWHYINQPLTGPWVAPDSDQVIWAVTHWQEQVQISIQPPQRAEALAFLLHFAGDIHQPLHVASFVGPEFPQGDAGGNRVKINCPWAKNLHQLWDSAGFPPQVSQQQLLTWALAASLGPELRQHQDPSQWAEEGLAWARRVGYPGGELPQYGPEYLEKVQQASLVRLHQAGFRLAHLLEQLGP